MAKVYLYGNIDSYSVSEFVEKIDEVQDGVLDLRICTGGGSVEYGWSAIAAFSEFQGKKSIVNEGKAFSMGTFFNLYTDDCAAYDVTEFLIHRAAYGWMEEEILKDDALKGNLLRINKSLEAAFRSKIDVEKFESLDVMAKNNYTVKDIFSLDNRIEVFITAQEAKKIGLINRVLKLTPQKQAMINARLVEVAASYSPKKEKVVESKTENKMTIDELKAKHPDVYAQIFSLGEAKGKETEKNRVLAWVDHINADSEAVIAGINDDKELTIRDATAFLRKEYENRQVTALENETSKQVSTNSTETVAAQAAAEVVEPTAVSSIEAKMNGVLEKAGLISKK